MVARNKSAAPLDTPNQGDTLTDLTLDIAFIPLSLDGVDVAGMAEPLGGPIMLMALDGPYRVTASARNMTIPEVALRDGMLNDTCGADGSDRVIVAECTVPAGSETRVANSWYCTNKPHIDVPISLALPNGGLDVPVTNVRVGANFSSGGGVYNHSTTLSMNGSLVGSAIVPSQPRIEGSLAPETLVLGGASPTQMLNLRSRHTNQAHYTITSGFTVTVDYDEHTRTGCFTLEEIEAAAGGALMCEGVPDLDVPPRRLSLTLDVDLEALSPEQRMSPYIYRIGEEIPLIARIGADGGEYISDTVRVELSVPRGLRPVGMTIQGEDQTLLGEIFTLLLDLLTKANPDLSELINALLGIDVDDEYITFVYDYDRDLVIGQAFPITLEVVGEVVGDYVIYGRVSVVDDALQSMASFSEPEIGLQQRISGAISSISRALRITVVQGQTSPSIQVTLINESDFLSIGISNELADMQAAANETGLIVHDGPTWNAMKLSGPDDSRPWMIPWGSTIDIDRQITLPNNEIWVRLTQSDEANDAWINLRNGQNGEHTYYEGSLDGLQPIGDMEIITFTYDRQAAAEYAIAHSYNNNTTARNANRVTERIPDFLPFAEFIYSELAPGGVVEATGSAQFISEILWAGGMPMTIGDDNNCSAYPPINNFGWRYCRDVRTSSKAWSVHKGIGIHFTMGNFPVPSGGSSNILITGGTQLGSQIEFDGLDRDDRISPVEDWGAPANIFRNLRQGGHPIGNNPGGLDKAKMGAFVEQHLVNLEVGDYLWINPYFGGTPHGLIIVGWQEANFCRDVLSNNTNPLFISTTLYATRGQAMEFTTNPVPYVSDYTTAQSPMPRPFYCTWYDQASDPAANPPPGQSNVLRFVDHWFHFYQMPDEIRLLAQQLHTNISWEWEGPQ